MLDCCSVCLQGIIHPVVALFIWSDDCNSLSPYRFCHHHCLDCSTFKMKAYFLDFAGGGAVHLLGLCSSQEVPGS